MTRGEFHCEACRKPIGGRRTHWITAGRVFCSACMATRTAHAIAFPECDDKWHDAHDHRGASSATLAAARMILAGARA